MWFFLLHFFLRYQPYICTLKDLLLICYPNSISIDWQSCLLFRLQNSNSIDQSFVRRNFWHLLGWLQHWLHPNLEWLMLRWWKHEWDQMLQHQDSNHLRHHKNISWRSFGVKWWGHRILVHFENELKWRIEWTRAGKSQT